MNMHLLPAALLAAATCLLLLAPTASADRNVIFSVYCNGSTASLGIAQSYSIPEVDKITFFWSVLGNLPTLLVAYQPNGANAPTPMVDCVKLALGDPAAISFPGDAPTYMSAVSLLRILEFDDSGKSGIMDSTSTICSTYDFKKDAVWSPFAFQPTPAASAVFQTVDNVTTVQFATYPATFRSDSPPQDILSENATKIDLQILGYNFNSSCSNNTKLAVELLFLDGNGLPATPHQLSMSSDSSINDEYTPTIFHIINIINPASTTFPNSIDGYFSWKPVSFTTLDRSFDQAMFSRSLNDDFSPLMLNTTSVPMSLSTVLLASRLRDLRSVNISFGTPEDSNYQPTVQLWGLSGGVGTPPSDPLSMIIIVTIALGFGVPGVLLVVGSVYVLIKRLAARKHGYQAIN